MTLQILNISEFDWTPIVAGVIGTLVGVISTYFNKRAEFKVLKENNASLQKEKKLFVLLMNWRYQNGNIDMKKNSDNIQTSFH